MNERARNLRVVREGDDGLGEVTSNMVPSSRPGAVVLGILVSTVISSGIGAGIGAAAGGRGRRGRGAAIGAGINGAITLAGAGVLAAMGKF